MMSGCIALALAGASACFTGDGKQAQLTCSDVEIMGIETCKDQFKRLGGVASTSSGSFIITPGYYCGSHDCTIRSAPGIQDVQ